jgi:2-ketoarginine methyltransferase
MSSGGRFSHEHLETFMSLVAGWSTAELVTGVLAHPDLLDELTRGTTTARLGTLTGLPPRSLRSILRALEVEGMVQVEGEAVGFTELGRSLEPMRGWIELFTRGYRGIFHDAEAVLGGTIDPEGRDMMAVGRASIAISEHGAIPMAMQAIERYAPDATVVMDVGCATGQFVIRLCQRTPGLRGLAVEPDADLADAARRAVADADLGDRIEVLASAAQDLDPTVTAGVISFAFVLQELLEQTSRAEVVHLLATLRGQNPGAVFVVIEVDAAGWQSVHMRDDAHLRGYYTPYFLVHDLTEQRLLSEAEWLEVFDDAGLGVLDTLRVDPDVDPTGLELAFVLGTR